jgi:2-methylisocitrate lyase-like PEP mutase family enzyme
MHLTDSGDGPSVSPMSDQHTRGERLAELHRAPRAFIIPNPWDRGTARLLEGLGFQAIATTSAGYAFSAGHPDDASERHGMLAHVAEIAKATRLPVSADLQDGFARDPDGVAQTILAAAECGAVGGSIEDRPYDTGEASLFPLELSVDRVRAAAAAARSLPFEFTLTARCETYLVGEPDLDDTIRRLRAYAEAGADVVYAPGLPTVDAIRAVVEAVDKPVNVVMGLNDLTLSLAELDAIGVRRISLGSTLARVCFGAFLDAARELQEHGTFDFMRNAVPFATIDGLFAQADANVAA